MKLHLASIAPGVGVVVLCGHKIRGKGSDLQNLVTTFRDVPLDDRCAYCESKRIAMVRRGKP